jgi:hypothetical protein
MHPLRWKVCAIFKVGSNHLHILKVIRVLKAMLLEKDNLTIVMGKTEIIALFIK